ncbi:MAG: DUF6544 family protein, partial [Bacteroidota bacterium]
MKLKIIFGILTILILALVVVVLINEFSFKRGVDAEVTALFQNAGPTDTTVVTEADLAHLPPPIQRYLRRSEVVGKPKVQFVRLRQRGTIRRGPEDAWMPFEAEQYHTVNPPGFVWHVRASVFPLLSMVGRDTYVGGKGNMHITLLSTITVVDVSGPELNQGAFVRFLSEIVWFPTAWLSDYLTWEAIDSSSARVTMRDGGNSASAVVFVNDEGDITNFTADRFMTVGDGFRTERWSIPMTGYGEWGGFRIPTQGEAVWQLESGDFS